MRDLTMEEVEDVCGGRGWYRPFIRGGGIAGAAYNIFNLGNMAYNNWGQISNTLTGIGYGFATMWGGEFWGRGHVRS